MDDDIPQSVRIRTGEGNEYRYHAVEEAAEFYDCNRSDAVAYACDNVPTLASAVETVLARDDLTPAQKQEIAQEFSVRGLEFDVSEQVSVNQG
ncbi:DUF7692 domain-containing protein [Haloarcula brevis]|uniref:DUF7692 domain-containing protein n=1 Tax=Haloarcula brevis TaxID=3111453 RepID=UPI00300F4CB9